MNLLSQSHQTVILLEHCASMAETKDSTSSEASMTAVCGLLNAQLDIIDKFTTENMSVNIQRMRIGLVASLACIPETKTKIDTFHAVLDYFTHPLQTSAVSFSRSGALLYEKMNGNCDHDSELMALRYTRMAVIAAAAFAHTAAWAEATLNKPSTESLQHAFQFWSVCLPSVVAVVSVNTAEDAGGRLPAPKRPRNNIQPQTGALDDTPLGKLRLLLTEHRVPNHEIYITTVCELSSLLYKTFTVSIEAHCMPMCRNFKVVQHLANMGCANAGLMTAAIASIPKYMQALVAYIPSTLPSRLRVRCVNRATLEDIRYLCAVATRYTSEIFPDHVESTVVDRVTSAVRACGERTTKCTSISRRVAYSVSPTVCGQRNNIVESARVQSAVAWRCLTDSASSWALNTPRETGPVTGRDWLELAAKMLSLCNRHRIDVKERAKVAAAAGRVLTHAATAIKVNGPWQRCRAAEASCRTPPPCIKKASTTVCAVQFRDSAAGDRRPKSGSRSSCHNYLRANWRTAVDEMCVAVQHDKDALCRLPRLGQRPVDRIFSLLRVISILSTHMAVALPMHSLACVHVQTPASSAGT